MMMYLIYILAERSVGARSGAPEAPVRTFIEDGNLSIPENLVLTSTYPRASEHPYTPVQTLVAGIKAQ